MNIARLYPARTDPTTGQTWYKPTDLNGWTSNKRFAHSDYKRKVRKVVARKATTTTPRRRKPKTLEKTPDVATSLVISNPDHPLIIFDNKLTVFSTCRDCRELMQVVYAEDKSHPCCATKMTKMESLVQGWRTAALNGDTEAERLTLEEIEKIEAQPPDMKRSALRYISWGWPVFPLVPKGIKTRGGEISDGKMPATPNGFKDATTDRKRIEKFWDKHPEYNIGLATGHLFDVIDVDVDTGGVVSLANCLRDKRITETHGVVVTASGGLHLYIPATGKGCRAGVEPGMDYRGTGGYVVAPPSHLGERGRDWSWLTTPSPKIRK